MKRRQFIQTSLQASSATLLLNAIAPRLSTATPARSPRQFALLVGINDYSYANSKNTPSLSGCVNDVALLKNLLIYRYGFNPADIITLTDQQATREAILTNFEQHLLTAQPDDTVVFAFSGHGCKYEKSTEKSTTAVLPYNHTVDANKQANYITGTTLLLLRSAFKTDNVTIILDCCYAGGGNRGDSTSRSAPSARANEAEQKYQAKLMRQLNLSETTLNQNRKTQKGTKGVLLAAASEWQKAQDSTFGANYNAGAFTKFLTQTLWENPTLPLNTVKQVVTEALISFSGQYAQTPEFTYPPDQTTQLQSRPTFVTTTPLSSIPAQGTVLRVDRVKREVTLWLGGLAARSLDLEPGAEFRCFVNQSSRSSSPIAKLSKTIEPNFTAIATIPSDQTLPEPGNLLQQYYRPLPADLSLRVGLDPSLNTTTDILQNRSRLQAISQKASGRFNGVDVILSQMTTEYQQLLPKNQPADKLPKIGSYCLFSSQLEIIPNSFGEPGETIEKAVDRLDSAFKVALIKKLFGAMTVTDQELTEVGTTAKVHLKGNPNAIIAQPNQLAKLDMLDQELEIALSTVDKNLHSLVVVTSSNGHSGVIPSTSFKLNKDDIATNIEILILVSPKSLDGISNQITELLNPSQLPSSQASRSVSTSQVDSVWNDLKESPGSRAIGGISPLVISLPIRVGPKQ
jgi:hypothetical protein